MKKLTTGAVAGLAALALAACGGDDGPSKSEEFAKDYKPLNAELLGVGKELGTTIQAADTQSDAALATQFEGLATDVGKIGGDIAALDPPEDDKADVDELTSVIDDAEETLNKIADAARAGDAAAARTNTVTLLRQSAALNKAQNKVAAATGAEKGSS